MNFKHSGGFKIVNFSLLGNWEFFSPSVIQSHGSSCCTTLPHPTFSAFDLGVHFVLWIWGLRNNFWISQKKIGKISWTMHYWNILSVRHILQVSYWATNQFHGFHINCIWWLSPKVVLYCLISNKKHGINPPIVWNLRHQQQHIQVTDAAISPFFLFAFAHSLSLSRPLPWERNCSANSFPCGSG